MFLNPETTSAILRFPGRRLTERLIKASCLGALVWFAYELARRMAGSASAFRESPVAIILLLVLALSAAAYVALRQQADLMCQTKDQSARNRNAEMERLGLLGAIHEASDAVVVADSSGIIRYVNPAFTRMTGYAAEEVVGQNPSRAAFGLDAVIHKQVRDTVGTGNTWHGEAANRRKNGTAYTEEITVMPVRDDDGVIRKYIAVRREIDARKSAHQTQSFLESLLETSEDAILTCTPDGMIASWNRGAELLYGYTAAEVTGQPMSMLAPAGKPAALKQIAEQIARGESVGQVEDTASTKSGEHVPISISARCLRDTAGNVTARAIVIRDISSRVEAREARALLSTIVDSADDAIFGTAPDGAIVSWNKGAEALYGYRASEILGKAVSMLAPTDCAADLSAALQRVAHGEDLRQWQTRAVTKDGAPVDILLNMSPVRDMHGAVVALSAVARDIRPQRKSEDRYQSLVAHLPDIVWVVNAAGQPVFASSNCQGVTGYSLEEVCRPGFWLSRVHVDDLPRKEAANRALFENGQPLDIEYRFQRKDGAWIWLHSRAVHTYERDGQRYREGLLSDITDRKNLQRKLAYQATHDTLTGLPNRAAFEDHLRQALARARRQGRMAALVYLDLDRFKRINDTLGHPAGDALIQLAAQRLTACLRSSEAISRANGDRFVAVLNDIRDAEEAIRVAERVLAALSSPFSVKGNEVFLTASIGIALYPPDGEDTLSLHQAADSALSAAKRHGKQRIQVANRELSQTAKRRLAVETELHYALDRDEFTLHYQPQFDLFTDRIAAVEALLRWQSPKLGNVPPSVLIPVAEESGLIVPLGARVLREACRQARRWRDSRYEPLQVAVNTSALQFARGDLAATVAATLAETGLEASALDLEVTESVIMHDLRETARQLRELKQLGVSVSLDDFGTGYSSLGYLEELPIDNLKIDRKFVQRMNSADNTRTLVESIVGLAHGLGMRAVAEGVETAQQLEQLRAMGCDRAQSFMLGGPAPALSIESLLAGQFSPRAVA
ncbi:MAG TPA: PAS domain S-box protein [Bryobacteraceae bacterium]|nr:PAS domain S-box protein [Bryobacteraceae bacterium]